jgi:hypothetical protein
VKGDQWKEEEIIEIKDKILSLCVNSGNLIALTSSKILIYRYDSDLRKYTMSSIIDIAEPALKAAILCSPLNNLLIYKNLEK